MKKLRIKFTEIESGKVIRKITVPLSVFEFAVKYTPESVYKYVLDLSKEDKNDSKVFKEIYIVISKIMRDAASPDKLAEYSGSLIEIEEDGERVEVMVC